MQDKYIKVALKEAKKAATNGEVPVGAVIVKDGKIIAKAYNKVEKKKNATYHAEIIAISLASKKIKNWRLNGCEMYVTLEPCSMCQSAIELSRIDKVYFLVKKDKEIKINNDKYECLEAQSEESLNLIQDFFKKRR